MEKLSFLPVKTSSRAGGTGKSAHDTTLGALIKDEMGRGAIGGCSRNSAYASYGGIVYTPWHYEHWGTGSSLEFVHAEPIGTGDNPPISCKVWFFFKNSDKHAEEIHASITDCE